MSNLKIKDEHYNVLKSKIQRMADVYGLEQLQFTYKACTSGIINCSHPQVYTMYSYLRKEWDGATQFICNELYPYMDDDNVTSALVRIGKELKVF